MPFKSLKFPNDLDNGLFTAESPVSGIEPGILQTFGKWLPNESQIYKFIPLTPPKKHYT